MKKRTKIYITGAFIAAVALETMSMSSERPEVQAQIQHGKKCIGYTVIEATKGIDCYGDTVKLVKRGGHFELASNQQ